MAGELERQLLGLRQGSHLCQIYDAPEERRAVLIPFFREGIAQGERCAYISEPPLSNELHAALSEAGVDVEREIHRGTLIFLSLEQTYLGGGAFEPRTLLDRIAALQDQAQAHGFPALRCVGDMGGAAKANVSAERIFDYETQLNRFLEQRPCRVICQYSRSHFSPAVLHGILRMHPLVVLGDEVCPNLYYEPPEDGSHDGRPDPAARRVEWMISQLRRSRAAETERERLMEQLNLQSGRLKAVIEQMPSGVLIAEVPSGKIVLANERIAPITRRPPIRGETLPEYQDWPSYHLDGRPYRLDEWPLVRAMNGEQVTDAEMVIKHADGTQNIISVNAGPIRDAAGAIVAAAVIIRDVTGRRQAEEALRASEERYRLLFERSLAAVYRSTLEGRLVDCNEAFATILGYQSPAEVMALPAWELYPERAEREAFLAALHRAEGTLANYEMRMRHKDGRTIYVLISGTLLADSMDTVIEGTFVDISARKVEEEATLLSVARYRSLIENLAQGVFLKDRELRYVLANRPLCEGLGRNDVVGHSDRDFFSPALADSFEADDRRILLGAERVERETALRAGGKERAFRIVKTPVLDERGQRVGVLGLCWDVTEQRRLEAQLRQAQKMEAIGLMAGGIAHDFNNLLSVILGNIALSLGGLSEHHPHRELLGAAERAGVQAAELTNRLLGFARQTILRPVPVQVQASMEETARLLHRTIDPRIRLEIRPVTNLWTVEADPAQMNQVLMNLCLNARDAMPEGGTLTLEAANVIVDDDLVRRQVEARHGEFVRLRVSDTGHGIPAEIRPRIFEPFFTTKGAGKGTGLGLAMVYGIVQQHQGWIDCVSETGAGTRFDIYLPRHGTSSGVIALPAEKPVPRGGPETILLADDEPMIRTLGRTILTRYGYRVLLAEDGVEAVEIYQQEMAKIDLVILDLTMPRLSGHDALGKLLQINPRVQVLLASGYSAEHLHEDHSERIAGFLSKPYRPEKLAQTVREVLDRAQNGSGI